MEHSNKNDSRQKFYVDSAHKHDARHAYYYLYKMFQLLKKQLCPYFEEYESEILKCDPKVFNLIIVRNAEFYRMSELCYQLIKNLNKEFESDYLRYLPQEEVMHRRRGFQRRELRGILMRGWGKTLLRRIMLSLL